MQITRFPLLFLLCLLLVTACSKPAQNAATPTELVPTATFSPLSPFIPADQGTPSFSRGELVNQ